MTQASTGSAATLWLTKITWGIALVVAAVSLGLGATGAIAGAALALVFAGVATAGNLMAAPASCSVVALGMVGQAVALTAGLTGHPWQIDAHMLFFALLAMIGTMVDIRAIVVATLAIALHHLSLAVVFPALVYPGAGGLADHLARTVMHAVIVLAEAAVLIQSVLIRQRFMAENERAAAALSATMAEAQAARTEAEHKAALAEDLARKTQEAAAEAQRANDLAENERMRAAGADAEAREAARREAEGRAAAASEVADVLRVFAQALERLSVGDLTVRLAGALPERFGKLGADFDAAISRLESGIATAADLSDRIGSRMDSIGSSSSDLAGRTESQIAALRQTTESVVRMAEDVRSAATLAGRAAAASSDADRVAEEGASVVSTAMDAVGKIAESSRQIARVTSVIEDIAFQTNLLALNAGVEAARAGEAGRGFAVVATEVRALAQRSSDSAKEIKDFIVASTAQVEAGVNLVNQTSIALKKMQESVTAIIAQVDTLSGIAQSQGGTMTEVTRALADLDRLVSKNAEMFKETASAGGALVDMSGELKSAMDMFQTGRIRPANRAQFGQARASAGRGLRRAG